MERFPVCRQGSVFLTSGMMKLCVSSSRWRLRMALCTSDGLFLWMPCRHTDRFYLLLDSSARPLCTLHTAHLQYSLDQNLVLVQEGSVGRVDPCRQEVATDEDTPTQPPGATWLTSAHLVLCPSSSVWTVSSPSPAWVNHLRGTS